MVDLIENNQDLSGGGGRSSSITPKKTDLTINEDKISHPDQTIQDSENGTEELCEKNGYEGSNSHVNGLSDDINDLSRLEPPKINNASTSRINISGKIILEKNDQIDKKDELLQIHNSIQQIIKMLEPVLQMVSGAGYYEKTNDENQESIETFEEMLRDINTKIDEIIHAYNVLVSLYSKINITDGINDLGKHLSSVINETCGDLAKSKNIDTENKIIDYFIDVFENYKKMYNAAENNNSFDYKKSFLSIDQMFRCALKNINVEYIEKFLVGENVDYETMRIIGTENTEDEYKVSTISNYIDSGSYKRNDRIIRQQKVMIFTRMENYEQE